MKRLVAALALCVAAALPIAVLPAPSAGATGTGTLGGYLAEGVYIRSGPSTSYGARGEGFETQHACIHAWVDGQRIGNDPVWGDNTDLTTGVTGYSAQHYMWWTPYDRCTIV